jgi:hypothetical protein
MRAETVATFVCVEGCGWELRRCLEPPAIEARLGTGNGGSSQNKQRPRSLHHCSVPTESSQESLEASLQYQTSRGVECARFKADGVLLLEPLMLFPFGPATRNRKLRRWPGPKF